MKYHSRQASKQGKNAIRTLCSALDETYATLERLTDHAESEKSTLQSIALPANEKSLAYVQAVLRHNFSPSKVAGLVSNLNKMQFEVRKCLDNLESSFRHVQDLYHFTKDGLERTSTSMSSVSTSTMLTARVKLARWLERREGTWRISSRSTSTIMRLQQRDSVFMSQSDFQLGDFLGTDHLSQMTSGILSKILCHLCSDGPLALRHLIFASKGLYYAAVNDASLWTTISFDTAFFKHFWRRPVEQAKSFTVQCLRQSSSLPLCIRLCCYSAVYLRHDRLLGPLRALRNPKYRGSERCTSLIWDCNGWGRMLAKNIVALLPNELPSLRHLSLSFYWDPSDGTQFPNCPVLDRVEMLMHRKPYLSHWGTNLAHVTTLSFGTDADWEPYDTSTLSLFPALQDLTLFATHTDRRPGSLVPKHQLAQPFQHLQTLRVRGSLPPELLTWLVAPTLEALHIEANDSGWTSTDTLGDSFSSLCLYLYALLPQIVYHKEPEWATDLSKYVQKCTRIETLFVSKWMEAECIASLGGSNVVLYVL